MRMAANGMLGFGTNINGNGGIYRVPAAGMPELLRAASGTYYNNGALDVNDAGTVCVQMEYMDPNSGLSRGLLVFDTPGDTLATNETTLMNAGVGVQPRVAMNSAGQVAFSLNDTVTIHYYTPPLPGSGMPSGTQTLQPGVYLATPVPFGTPFTYTLIASNADGYSDFGEIDLNDQGVVVSTLRRTDGRLQRSAPGPVEQPEPGQPVHERHGHRSQESLARRRHQVAAQCTSAGDGGWSRPGVNSSPTSTGSKW
jgi:hypothetical protein